MVGPAPDGGGCRRAAHGRGERLVEGALWTRARLGIGAAGTLVDGADVEAADRTLGPLDEGDQDAFDAFGEPIGLLLGHHRGVVFDLDGEPVIEVGHERHRVVRCVRAGEPAELQRARVGGAAGRHRGEVLDDDHGVEEFPNTSDPGELG